MSHAVGVVIHHRNPQLVQRTIQRQHDRLPATEGMTGDHLIDRQRVIVA